MLLLVPVALGVIVGLLVLTTALEQRRAQALVRFTMHSKAGPETAENIIAEELASLLEAKGLATPPRSARA